MRRLLGVLLSLGVASAALAQTPTPTAAPCSITTSNLQMRYDARSLALSDTDPVSSWPDSSGNARDIAQGTGANQPVFHTSIANGNPCVYFDGTNDNISGTATVAALQANTSKVFYAVVVPDTPPLAYQGMARYGDTSGAGSFYGIMTSTSQFWQIGQGTYDLVSSTIPSASTTYVVTARKVGSTLTLYVDNSIIAGPTGLTAAGITGNEIILGSGGSIASPASYFKGYICDALMFSGTQTDTVLSDTSYCLMEIYENASTPTPTSTPTETPTVTATPSPVYGDAAIFFTGITIAGTGNYSVLHGSYSGDTSPGYQAVPMITGGQARDLYVKCNDSIASGSASWTLYKNGSATALTATLTGVDNNHDTSNTVEFSAGDTLEIVMGCGATTTVTQCGGGMRVLGSGGVGGHHKLIVSTGKQAFTDPSPTPAFFSAGCENAPNWGAGSHACSSSQTVAQRKWVMPNSGTISGFGVHYKTALASGETDTWTLQNLTTATDVVSVAPTTGEQTKTAACTVGCSYSAGDVFTVKATHVGADASNARTWTVEEIAETQPIISQGLSGLSVNYWTDGSLQKTPVPEVIPLSKKVNAIYGIGQSAETATMTFCSGTGSVDCTGTRPVCSMSAATTCFDATAPLSLTAGDLFYMQGSTSAWNGQYVSFSADLGDFPTPTETPTGTATSTETFTVTPTETAMPTETATATNTPTITPTFTSTSTPTDTFTAMPTSTATDTPTQTPTPTSTPTRTPTPTDTSTSTPTPTVTATFKHCVTITPTPPQGNCGSNISLGAIYTQGPTSLWRFAEATGTPQAADAVDSNPATYTGQYVLGHGGLDLQGLGYAQTTVEYDAPTEMTVLMGIRGQTGSFAQFAAASGGQANYLLEVSAAGTLWWGVQYGSGQFQLVPPSIPWWGYPPIVSDGRDHLIVATLGETYGQQTFLDGDLVDTKAFVYPLPTPGYWTFGYANVAGWPNTSTYGYTGRIYCAALWNDRQLNADDVNLIFRTPTPTVTPTRTPTRTSTPSPTRTRTITKTPTQTRTRTPTLTPTP